MRLADLNCYHIKAERIFKIPTSKSKPKLSLHCTSLCMNYFYFKYANQQDSIRRCSPPIILILHKNPPRYLYAIKSIKQWTVKYYFISIFAFEDWCNSVLATFDDLISKDFRIVTFNMFLFWTLCIDQPAPKFWNYRLVLIASLLSLIHIWRCRRYAVCRSRWSPYH
mgnify:CR=1 FL=1